MSDNKSVWLAKIRFIENSQAASCSLSLLENHTLCAVCKAGCSSGSHKINGSPSFVCEKLVKIM